MLPSFCHSDAVSPSAAQKKEAVAKHKRSCSVFPLGADTPKNREQREILPASRSSIRLFLFRQIENLHLFTATFKKNFFFTDAFFRKLCLNSRQEKESKDEAVKAEKELEEIRKVIEESGGKLSNRALHSQVSPVPSPHTHPTPPIYPHSTPQPPTSNLVTTPHPPHLFSHYEQ